MGNAVAGEFVRKSPASPDVRARYIFYMHGRWVEMNGQSDHRAHGLCDYDGIISKFAKHGLVVIGLEHPNDTRIIEYAQNIAAQVPQLLDKGATAERIAVSKHS